jgi:hypothetical protein
MGQQSGFYAGNVGRSVYPVSASSDLIPNSESTAVNALDL